MEEGVRRAEPGDSERFLELMWESFNALMTRRGGGLLVATPGAAFDMILDFGRFDELVSADDRIVLL